MFPPSETSHEMLTSLAVPVNTDDLVVQFGCADGLSKLTVATHQFLAAETKWAPTNEDRGRKAKMDIFSSSSKPKVPTTGSGYPR